MSQGSAFSVSSGNFFSVGGNPGVSCTMLLPSSSVNQIFPSGPVVMNVGKVVPGPVGNSNTKPDGSIRPTWSTVSSVNQRVPSGNAVMSHGWELGVNPAYSVITPA